MLYVGSDDLFHWTMRVSQESVDMYVRNNQNRN